MKQKEHESSQTSTADALAAILEVCQGRRVASVKTRDFEVTFHGPVEAEVLSAIADEAERKMRSELRRAGHDELDDEVERLKALKELGVANQR